MEPPKLVLLEKINLHKRYITKKNHEKIKSTNAFNIFLVVLFQIYVFFDVIQEGNLYKPLLKQMSGNHRAPARNIDKIKDLIIGFRKVNKIKELIICKKYKILLMVIKGPASGP